MPEAYLVDGVRTAVGRYGGALAAVRPDDLAAHVLKSLVERTGVPVEAIDEVIFGAGTAAGGATIPAGFSCWPAGNDEKNSGCVKYATAPMAIQPTTAIPSRRSVLFSIASFIIPSLPFPKKHSTDIGKILSESQIIILLIWRFWVP